MTKLRSHPLLCTLLVSAAVALGVTVPLPAQVKPHEKTAPRVFTGTLTPASLGANIFFGRSRCLFQCWFEGRNFTPGPILQVALQEQSIATPLQHRLEIVMANTTAGFAMSKQFAQNLGPNPTTFFAMKNVSLPAVTVTGANQSSTWFVGDRPVIYSGPNFIVQWDIQTSATFGTQGTRTMAGLYQTSTAPLTGLVGTPCGAASLTSRYLTGNLLVEANNLRAMTPSILLVGFDSAYFAGAIRLPFDLSGLGYSGCTLDVDPVFTFVMSPTTANASSITLPIPIPTGTTYNVHCQALVVDPSKPAGWATTNASWALIGNTGLANYMYNWTQDGPTAQYGPYAVNSSVVHYFKP